MSKTIDYLKTFGFGLTCQKALNNFLIRNKNKFPELYRKSAERWIETIKIKIKPYCDEVAKKDNLAISDAQSNIIWICWWQGEEKMPDSIKFCVDSVKRVYKDNEIVILDRDNFCNYVDIPEHIINRFNDGIISITHLTDLLRCYLLANWGGCWVDASLYFYRKDMELLDENADFYSAQTNVRLHAGAGRWTVSLMRGKSPVFQFVYDSLCEYWKNNIVMVDYFLIDYIFDYYYEYHNDFRKAVDRLVRPKYDLFSYSKIISDNVQLDLCPPCIKLNWRNIVEKDMLEIEKYFK